MASSQPALKIPTKITIRPKLIKPDDNANCSVITPAQEQVTNNTALNVISDTITAATAVTQGDNADSKIKVRVMKKIIADTPEIIKGSNITPESVNAPTPVTQKQKEELHVLAGTAAA